MIQLLFKHDASFLCFWKHCKRPYVYIFLRDEYKDDAKDDINFGISMKRFQKVFCGCFFGHQLKDNRKVIQK